MQTAPGEPCVDKYEASVWDIPPGNTALIQKVKDGTATLADLTGGGATQISPTSSCSPGFPGTFPDDGHYAAPLYAASVPGVNPTACITAYQAADLYLDPLDHFVREALGVRQYLRYMDDFVLMVATREEGWVRLREIRGFLDQRLRLRLNQRRVILAPVRGPLDVLGYVYRPDGRLRVRRRSVRRLWRRLAALEAGDRTGELFWTTVRSSVRLIDRTGCAVQFANARDAARRRYSAQPHRRRLRLPSDYVKRPTDSCEAHESAESRSLGGAGAPWRSAS